LEESWWDGWWVELAERENGLTSGMSGTVCVCVAVKRETRNAAGKHLITTARADA
jgi:hypothetical protein